MHNENIKQATQKRLTKNKIIPFYLTESHFIVSYRIKPYGIA